MDYTIEEVRLLYRCSPAKVYEKLKACDILYVDQNSLEEALRILLICKIGYHVSTDKIAERNVHEIMID